MRITEVEVIPIRVPISKSLSTAYGTVIAGDYIVMKLHTDEEITGIGESGMLYPAHSGESHETALSFTKEIIAPYVLLNEDPFNIDKIIHTMDKLIYGHNLLKASIDFALFDIIGKALSLPVYKLLGGCSFLDTKIPLGWVVSGKNPKDAAVEAYEYAKAGFKYMKVKVATSNIKEDIERVRQVRDAIGDYVGIMVDANMGYTPINAIKAIKEMSKYDIFMVEQPVARWDLAGLAKVRRKVDVPIMADESAYSIEDAMNVIRVNAADALLLKPTRIGGLFKGKQYAALARATNIDVIGCSVIGTGLELAAMAHFTVSSITMKTYPHQFVSPLLLFGGTDTLSIKGDIVRETPRIKDGYLTVPEGPGFGVELNAENIEKYLKKDKGPIVCRK